MKTTRSLNDMLMEKMITDIECPIKCGYCCHWDCPHKSEPGCLIERRFRPFDCNAYLCGEGTIAYYEQLEEA